MTKKQTKTTEEVLKRINLRKTDTKGGLLRDFTQDRCWGGVNHKKKPPKGRNKQATRTNPRRTKSR